MAELLLVSNPHKRRRRKNPTRHRRRNPARSHRRRRRANPSRHHARRRRNPAFRVHRRRRHRNPSIRDLTARVVPVIKESYLGAFGALGNDVLYGLASPYIASILGANVGMGTFVQYGVKMLSALGVGWLARFAKLPGRDLAVGAGTVATHDFLKLQLQSMAPTIFGPGGMVALSGYSGLGAYLSGSAPLVGTATFPATYLPQSQPTMGAYLSGSSGMADGAGTYMDDAMGMNYWECH